MLRGLTLSLFLLFTSQSFAFVIVGFEGEPFYFKNGSEGVAGVCHELMQTFCDKEKLHCKFKIAPLPLVLDMMKNGKADATCPLSETDERTRYIAYTDKIFKTRFAFFAVPETANKVKTVKDLGNLSVGVFTPSRVSESLDEILRNSPVKFEVIKENSNISTLLRAEKISKVLAYMNHEIAMRWIEKSHSHLVEAPLKGEVLAYNIGFSKKTLSSEKIAKYIKSVHDIKNSKQMIDIAAKAGLTFWDEAAATKTAVDDSTPEEKTNEPIDTKPSPPVPVPAPSSTPSSSLIPASAPVSAEVEDHSPQ